MVTNNADEIKHCWQCTVSFGPEPKPEPTPGKWWYNHATGNIVATLGGSASCVASVSLTAPPSEQEANGILLAASKMLLAACKRVAVEAYGNKSLVEQAKAAIADAEGK